MEYCNAICSTDLDNIEGVLNDLLHNNDISKQEVIDVSKRVSQVLIDAGVEVGSVKPYANGRRVKRKSPLKLWYNDECETKRKVFQKAKNDIRNGICDKDFLKTKSKEYRDALKKSYHNYHRAVCKRLRILKSNNSKEYWNLLSKLPNVRNESNTKLNVNLFVEHFKKLGNSSDVSDQNNWSLNNHNIPGNDGLNTDFTIEEISKVVAHLKNGKSPGCDYVINEFIKSAFPKLSKIRCMLFNIVLSSGHVPDEWSIGYIIPLYKNKGEKHNPDNYRGITLLSCIGKLFTSVLNYRLNKYLDEYKLLGEEQAGFRGGYSTTDHIFAMDVIINM